MAERRTLDRRRILKTALDLADREGLDAVTMRRVARELGAGTMSLYHYVPGKEALLEGMVDFVFEKVEQPPDEIRGWVDRVLFISLSFRRAALVHPMVVSLIASGSFSGPVVLQSTETYVRSIVQGGLVPEAATHVYRAATSYVIGYLSLELGGYFGSAVESFRRGGLENTGTEKYPALSELAPYLSAWNPEREFETGLRRLLAGFSEDPASGIDQSTPDDGK